MFVHLEDLIGLELHCEAFYRGHNGYMLAISFIELLRERTFEPVFVLLKHTGLCILTSQSITSYKCSHVESILRFKNNWC